MNILWIKLVTGEDLVADVVQEESTYTLNKPVRIIMTPDGAAMIPAPPLTKSTKLKIQEQHIVYTAVPDEEILNAYNSKYGSGILTPKTLSIVT